MSRFLPLAAVLLCLAGCADKLRFEQSFSLPDTNAADYKQFDLDPQPREQSVAIDVKVTGDPVDVYLVPKEKAAGFPDSGKEKRAAAALGSLPDTSGGTLTVKVPAKTAFSVFVFQTKLTNKKSDVVLKLKN